MVRYSRQGFGPGVNSASFFVVKRCRVLPQGQRPRRFDFFLGEQILKILQEGITMEEIKSLLRLRMSAKDAHYGGNLVDGAHMVHLFGDVATELLIICDGDEGLFCAYDNVEFLAPVFAGDYIEAEGKITKIASPAPISTTPPPTCCPSPWWCAVPPAPAWCPRTNSARPAETSSGQRVRKRRAAPPGAGSQRDRKERSHWRS